MSLAESGIKKIFVQPIGYCQSCTLQVRSVGVTTSQTYDRISRTFVPDYSDESSMLQIFPECVLVNPDSPIASSKINAQLSNVTWKEVTPSGTTTIFPVTSPATGVKDGYEVTRDGENKGELFVKCNGTVGVKRTLRFEAKWYDPNSSYCYNFVQDIGLTIENATEPLPELVLGVPNTYQWNPFRNPRIYQVDASLFVGKQNLIDDARTKLFWYRINEDKSKTLITSEDDITTLEISSIQKNANGQITSLIFDMEMIGDASSYEVVACFRSSGSLPSEPMDSDPRSQFTLVRQIPKLTAEIMAGNAVVGENIPSVQLTAIVKDNMDIIPNWEEHAEAYWYKTITSVSQNGTASESRTLLGKGKSIIVPSKDQNNIRLIIDDKGSYKPMVDDDGNYLVTDDGEYLIERDIV